MDKVQLNETLIAKGRIIESENLPAGVLCRGVWPTCNIEQLNANKRIYGADVWERVRQNEDIISKMKGRTFYGQAEHPAETTSDLQLTSHIVTEMYIDKATALDESEGDYDVVYSKVDVLDTPCGRIINTLIEAGCQIGVSTRAEGDLEEAEDDDGNKYQRVVAEAYDYRALDFTADPSTYGTQPQKVQSSLMVAATEGATAKENRLPRAYAQSILESLKFKGKQDKKTLAEAIKALKEARECPDNPGCACADCGKCSKDVKEGEKEEQEEDYCPDCTRVTAGGQLCPDCEVERTKKASKTEEELVPKSKGLTHKRATEPKEAKVIEVGQVIEDVNHVKGTVKSIDEKQVTIELEDGTTLAIETTFLSTENVEVNFAEQTPLEDLMPEPEPGVVEEPELEPEPEPPVEEELPEEEEEEELDAEGKPVKKKKEKLPFEGKVNDDLDYDRDDTMGAQAAAKEKLVDLESRLSGLHLADVAQILYTHVVPEGAIDKQDFIDSIIKACSESDELLSEVYEDVADLIAGGATDIMMDFDGDEELPESKSDVKEYRVGQVVQIKDVEGNTTVVPRATVAATGEALGNDGDMHETIEVTGSDDEDKQQWYREDEYQISVLESKTAQKRRRKLRESYEEMVNWMEAYFKRTPKRKRQVLVAKLVDKVASTCDRPLTESKVGVTAKTIRKLQIKEASTRAERDEACVLLDGVDDTIKEVNETRDLETRIMVRKLKKANSHDSQVPALCQMLERRTQNMTAIQESLAKVRKAHVAEVAAVRVECEVTAKRVIIEGYVRLKLSHSGLVLPKSSRTLLEGCETVEEVDQVFGQVKEAIRRGALRPQKIDSITVKQVKEASTKDRLRENIKERVRSIARSM